MNLKENKNWKLPSNSEKTSRSKDKLRIFVDHLKNVASLSKSTRLKVGALALRKDFQREYIAYNGSVTNAPIYEETGSEEESLEPGKSGFVHAEMNLIAKFRETNPQDYIILLTHSPCSLCTKLLINSGFKHIYWLENYRSTDHIDILMKGRIKSYGKIDYLFRGPFLYELFSM